MSISLINVRGHQSLTAWEVVSPVLAGLAPKRMLDSASEARMNLCLSARPGVATARVAKLLATFWGRPAA
jgi:hypothetical protein